MTFIRFERNILSAELMAHGGEGGATAPTTALDEAISEIAGRTLKDCRAEKYAAGTPFSIEARGRGGERFEVSDDGVISIRPIGRNKETGEQQYASARICPRLDVLGASCNADGESWGRVISFKDGKGLEHRLTLSMEDILSGGTGLTQKLGKAGLDITDATVLNGWASVNRYLLAFDPNELKAIKTVSRNGWTDDSFSCFALGGKTVRIPDGDYAELAADAVCAPVKSRGTLAEWQAWINGIAPYSDRMSFAVMVALAAPLLQIVGDMSRLFHFYGGSSTGKTSAVKAAGTVWGGLDWVQSWDTSRQAPTALAKRFNCLPLIFDELKAARGVVKDVSYLLASGKDRARCGRDGKIQETESWSLYVLSTGEGSLQEIKQQTCRGADADTATGELVRFIDIPAVANPENPENGIFESFPEGIETANARREWINSFLSAPTSYGTAGLAFLDALERNISENGLEAFRKNLNAWINEFSSGLSVTAATTSRVAMAFAIVAAAGELAREYGVLPWEEGKAADVAKTCFAAWRSSAASLENRGENFVNAVLDDTKRCEASYTRHKADGLAPSLPVGSTPSFGTLLIQGDGNNSETMCAFYRPAEFSDLLKRAGGGVMNGEAMAFLKKQNRLITNCKDTEHLGQFKAPAKKPVALGLLPKKHYRLVVISDDKGAVLRLLESLKLNPPKEA